MSKAKSPEKATPKKVSPKGTAQKAATKKSLLRAEAVDKNLGKIQPLHAFLSGVGWR